MSKYEKAKILKVVKGRREYECAYCGATTNVGDLHAVEHLGLIRKPPDVVLSRYCKSCYDEYGESLIAMQREKARGPFNDF